MATKHQPSSSVCTPHPRNSLLTFSGEYHYTSAIALHEELGQRSGVASVTVNIGIVYQNLGEYGKSLEYFTRAKALNEEIGDRSGVARVIGNIGLVYQNLGEYGKSLEYYTRAIALHEKLGERSGVADITGPPPKKWRRRYVGILQTSGGTIHGTTTQDVYQRV